MLTANAAYVHAKFGKFVTAKGDATGYPLANVPRLQLTGGARYTFPRSDLGEISIGGDVFYQSKVWYDDVAQDPAVFGPISSLRQKGYALVSLRLDWEGILNSALDGSIYVTNLTKTKYRTSTQTQLFDGFGYNTQFPGEPRVFGAELRYKF